MTTMSALVGKSSVVRWLSKGSSWVRQNGSVLVGNGNGGVRVAILSSRAVLHKMKEMKERGEDYSIELLLLVVL